MRFNPRQIWLVSFAIACTGSSKSEMGTNTSTTPSMSIADAQVMMQVDIGTIRNPGDAMNGGAVDAEILLDDGRHNPCGESDRDGDGFGTDPSCSVLDCNDENPSIHPNSSEACNGRDDDCDARIDESIPSVTCGDGMCRVTRPSCIDGSIQRCQPTSPSTEICNGIDDDCDGNTDELILPETCGLGACQQTSICEDGIRTNCEPSEPSVELCDAIDNDCDGFVDENFGGSMHRVSYEELADIVDTCNGQGWSNVSSSDCDVAMHRYCASRACFSAGYGPAENGEGRAWITCLSSADLIQTTFTELSQYHSVCAVSGERRGPNCNAAISRFCRAGGFESGFGPVESEDDTALIVCLRNPEGTDKLYEYRSVSYSTLAQAHTPCNGERERIGPNCNAAIKRHCVTLGAVSGFGPNENYGEGANAGADITCVYRSR